MTPPKRGRKADERELRKVAHAFADACVDKALLRLKEHPDRSPRPYYDYTTTFHADRLNQEVKELTEAIPKSMKQTADEATDVGNFAAWIWWRNSDAWK
jgi:hypothetical protein